MAKIQAPLRPKHFLRRFRHHSSLVHSRITTLIRQPIFVILTVAVNGIILGASGLVLHFESAENPAFSCFSDALYWAVSTFTTVGYGDITPISQSGRILAMLLMIAGSLFNVLYTALFATALIAPELKDVEHQVREVEAEFREIGRTVRTDNRNVVRLTRQMRELLDLLEQMPAHDENKPD